ncbi:MAG: Pr6Pr family membrane protein [Bacteroidales bacterium]|nr:Pr6Pr family membrane protein [Bacteroidales bacterium]MDD2424626.1 Pr6Pr family membrane protein [Bacteroidales bacterium]MDD3988700.1 Pr6Pr family membrane protein [Bacteroidales bacterium]MDD4639260.1 Pr6Pr family membrane protein [Bacteroidales bacterium]
MKNKALRNILLFLIFMATLQGIFLNISVSSNGEGFVNGLYVFKYFTLQSNLLLMLFSCVTLILINTGKSVGQESIISREKRSKYGKMNEWIDKLLSPLLSYILLTGITYALIIAPTANPEGLAKISTILLHYVSPSLAIIYFILFEKRRIDYREIALWIIYPIVFLGWGLYLAIIKGDYLYPFFDIEKLGYKIIPYLFAVTLGGILLDIAVVFVNRRLNPKSKN